MDQEAPNSTTEVFARLKRPIYVRRLSRIEETPDDFVKMGFGDATHSFRHQTKAEMGRVDPIIAADACCVTAVGQMADD